MQYKTLDQIINDHPFYKPASLYNAVVRSIKVGPLRGKAIPLNRNDPNAKFRLPKAVTRSGRTTEREVTNFVILDTPAFDGWFETNKAGIRTTRALGRTQVVMPRLEDIESGQYTPEQLSQLAEHVANKRYGPHRSGAARAEAAAAKNNAQDKDKEPAKRGRKPRKVLED